MMPMIFVNNIQVHLFKIKSILHVCELLLYTIVIVKYLHAFFFAAAAVSLTMFTCSTARYVLLAQSKNWWRQRMLFLLQ